MHHLSNFVFYWSAFFKDALRIGMSLSVKPNEIYSNALLLILHEILNILLQWLQFLWIHLRIFYKQLNIFEFSRFFLENSSLELSLFIVWIKSFGILGKWWSKFEKLSAILQKFFWIQSYKQSNLSENGGQNWFL